MKLVVSMSNVYGAIAATNVIIVHLGDYIYEGYRKKHFSGSEHHPSHELLTLDDYRRRYRQYRQDAPLQKIQQLKPFICTWDDHEFASNTYKNGATGHQNNEGNFRSKISMSVQVWHEYLPCRAVDPSNIYRNFNLGGAVNLPIRTILKTANLKTCFTMNGKVLIAHY
jgi:alkaline phosphatase D